MARIVETHVEPVVSLVIQTLKTDGSVLKKELHVGDMADIRYVSGGDVLSVSGRVGNLNYKHKVANRTYNDVTKVRSYFADDTTTDTLNIDCSKEYESNVVPVPTREIVEDDGVLDVERMKYFLTYGVKFEIELTDNTSNVFELYEGQEVVGLEYLDRGGISTVNGKLVAIECDEELIPSYLVLIVNDRIKTIPVSVIKNVGTTIAPVDASMSVTDAIANDASGVVPLATGTYVEEINVTKDIVLKGAQAGVPATYGSARASKTTSSLETVFSGKLKVDKGVSVTLDGITLSESAYIEVADAKDLHIKNCRVLNIVPEKASGAVILTTGSEPMKLEIKNCYFGPNSVSGDHIIYNAFDCNAPLADGSEISGNYFDNYGCTHNHISLYDMVDGATVTISNNTWEKSANGIRIGNKGEPKCTVIIENNTYFSTDSEYPEWSGLLLIQPYGLQTTTMTPMTVYINNTKHNDDGQIYYLYDGGPNYMQFDETNLPTVIIDGVVEKELNIIE